MLGRVGAGCPCCLLEAAGLVHHKRAEAAHAAFVKNVVNPLDERVTAKISVMKVGEDIVFLTEDASKRRQRNVTPSAPDEKAILNPLPAKVQITDLRYALKPLMGFTKLKGILEKLKACTSESPIVVAAKAKFVFIDDDGAEKTITALPLLSTSSAFDQTNGQYKIHQKAVQQLLDHGATYTESDHEFTSRYNNLTGEFGFLNADPRLSSFLDAVLKSIHILENFPSECRL